MNKQEIELLEGFRRLCDSTRETIITAVNVAVFAEAAVRRELAGKEQILSTKPTLSLKEEKENKKG